MQNTELNQNEKFARIEKMVASRVTFRQENVKNAKDAILNTLGSMSRRLNESFAAKDELDPASLAREVLRYAERLQSVMAHLDRQEEALDEIERLEGCFAWILE